MCKNLAIISFTDKGEKLADRLVGQLEGINTRHYPCDRGGLSSIVSEAFESFDALMFIGAAGIAVRAIAPHIRSKMHDPAVIVADEAGDFVIPVLSGHVGGANEAALYIAEIIGATPVITTATDINGAFAVDVWASKNGYVIANPESIKDVSMKALRGERIEILADTELLVPPPESQASVCKVADFIGNFSQNMEHGIVDVYVGSRIISGGALRLVPRMLYVGIGCRRGVSSEAVGALFERVFAEYGIDARAVASVASIDIKSDEGGLLGFAEERGYELRFYSADELNRLDDITGGAGNVRSAGNVCITGGVGGVGDSYGADCFNAMGLNGEGGYRAYADGGVCGAGEVHEGAGGVCGTGFLCSQFSHSEFVESVVGVDCVCERAAVAAAIEMSGSARIMVKKTVGDGVTVAVAAALRI